MGNQRKVRSIGKRAVGVAGAGDEPLDVLVPVGPPEPELVPKNGSADVEPPVEVGLQVAGAVDTPRPQLVVDVVRLDVLVAVEHAARPVKRVRAALGDHVQDDARGLHVGAVRVRLDLHLVEGVDVVVEERGPGAVVVRHVGAVEDVVVLPRVGSAAAERELVARVGAADVRRARDEPGGLRDHGPHVAGVRHGVHQFLGEREADVGGTRVDDGRPADDRHRLFEARHGELGVEREGRVRLNPDTFVLLGLEARELEGDRVGADRDVGHAVTRFRRHRDHRAAEDRGAADGHGHPGERGAGGVHQPSLESARLLLRAGCARSEDERDDKKAGSHDGYSSTGAVAAPELTGSDDAAFRLARLARRNTADAPDARTSHGTARRAADGDGADERAEVYQPLIIENSTALEHVRREARLSNSPGLPGGQ